VPKTIAPTEVKVERDPETGKILRVIHPKTRSNPLNDPLNSDSEDEDMDAGEGEAEEKNPIVAQLEEQARSGKEKKERTQSEREREWIANLVRVHGDNYKKMAWDRKLNPMQQTEADLKRRIAKWRAQGGEVAASA
jgi:nucleolar protein 16